MKSHTHTKEKWGVHRFGDASTNKILQYIIALPMYKLLSSMIRITCPMMNRC